MQSGTPANRIAPGGARVLVTGATSGVGEATARLFAARGSRVALLGRRADELERVAAAIGDATIWFTADVADPVSVADAVSSAISELGGLDVAVNAAGVASYAEIQDLDASAWRAVVDTNLSGTFYVARDAGLYMRANGGGAIVNVASDLAVMGAPGLAHYCASKAGVVALTRAMALELAPSVRVNVVCPGPIDTPMLRAGIDDAPDPVAALRAKEATVPLGRLADAAEVALAIYFLAIDGTFATGTAMALDGGTSAA